MILNNFNNTYVLKLDVKQQNPNPQVKIVQYDSAYLKIELYDNGKKMELKEGERFTVSTVHEATGEKNTGLAEYDGNQFIVYEMRHADMKQTGSYTARFASYKDRERVTSLVFRYEVYEDFENIGNEEELTMLQELFIETEEVGRVTQRQGEYAEDRGDYANAAGDYANTAGDSRMMNWIPYVKTIQERGQKYPNPNNGDTLYVINENKVFRYDGIDALDWEPIAGWDTSVIQDIYNTKEDKVVVKQITDEIKQQIKDLTVGARNLLGGTHFRESFSPTVKSGFNSMFNNTEKTVLISPSSTYTTSSYYSFNLEKPILADSYATLQFKVRAETEASVVKFKIGNLVWSDPITIPQGSTYNRYVMTIPTKVLSSNQDRLYITHDKPLEFEKESLKLEEASKPSTWTPSYLDVFNLLDAHKLRMDNMDTRMDGMDKRMDTNDVRVQAIETDVAGVKRDYVKKEIFDENIKQQTTKWSEIAQSSESLSFEVGKKVGIQEVKSLINQSAETIKIKASNIDFDGAIIFKQTENNKVDPNAYVRFSNGGMQGRGYYERKWRDGIVRKRNQEYGFVDGMLRISDPQGAYIDTDKYGIDYINYVHKSGRVTSDAYRSIYYSSDGISTYRDGSGMSFNEEGRVTSSGTIEFFSHTYSNSRGVTIYSAGGAVALQATNNCVHIDSSATAYTRSRKSSVILRPHEDVRNGYNEFQFGVSTDNSGRFYFGDYRKDDGVGLRFVRNKNNPTIRGIDGKGASSGNVTLDIGVVKANKFLSRNGKNSVYFNGTGGGTLTGSNTLVADGIRTNATNFYVGVDGELRVTNKRGYNSGGRIGYLPVRASKFNTVSSRKYKDNIKDLEIDTLDILKNTDIKQYNLKTDLENGVNKTKYGVILEDSPEAIIEGDGIDNYAMLSILWDVVKKQQNEIELLKKK